MSNNRHPILLNHGEGLDYPISDGECVLRKSSHPGIVNASYRVPGDDLLSHESFIYDSKVKQWIGYDFDDEKVEEIKQTFSELPDAKKDVKSYEENREKHLDELINSLKTYDSDKTRGIEKITEAREVRVEIMPEEQKQALLNATKEASEKAEIINVAGTGRRASVTDVTDVKPPTPRRGSI